MKNRKIKEIEEKYGVDFGEDNEMRLSEYLRKMGFPSLAELLEIKKRRKK